MTRWPICACAALTPGPIAATMPHGSCPAITGSLAAGLPPIASLPIGWSGSAAAAGFAIQERAAAELGVGYAGAAAAAEDASSIADNPAGIARLTAPQLLVTGTFAVPTLPFTDAGSVLPTGKPIS